MKLFLWTLITFSLTQLFSAAASFALIDYAPLIETLVTLLIMCLLSILSLYKYFIANKHEVWLVLFGFCWFSSTVTVWYDQGKAGQLFLSGTIALFFGFLSLSRVYASSQKCSVLSILIQQLIMSKTFTSINCLLTILGYCDYAHVIQSKYRLLNKRIKTNIDTQTGLVNTYLSKQLQRFQFDITKCIKLQQKLQEFNKVDAYYWNFYLNGPNMEAEIDSLSFIDVRNLYADEVTVRIDQQHSQLMLNMVPITNPHCIYSFEICISLTDKMKVQMSEIIKDKVVNVFRLGLDGHNLNEDYTLCQLDRCVIKNLIIEAALYTFLKYKNDWTGLETITIETEIKNWTGAIRAPDLITFIDFQIPQTIFSAPNLKQVSISFKHQLTNNVHQQVKQLVSLTNRPSISLSISISYSQLDIFKFRDLVRDICNMELKCQLHLSLELNEQVPNPLFNETITEFIMLLSSQKCFDIEFICKKESKSGDTKVDESPAQLQLQEFQECLQYQFLVDRTWKSLYFVFDRFPLFDNQSYQQSQRKVIARVNQNQVSLTYKSFDPSDIFDIQLWVTQQINLEQEKRPISLTYGFPKTTYKINNSV